VESKTVAPEAEAEAEAPAIIGKLTDLPIRSRKTWSFSLETLHQGN
jgi:hypothetical protein